MDKDNEKFNHLIMNVERITPKNTIFNYESGQKAFRSLGEGNTHDWLKTLLPNTRLILEPKIIGSSIAIQYINGELNKAINKNCVDITEEIKHLKSVPQNLPINQRIEIRGVLYDNHNKLNKRQERISLIFYKLQTKENALISVLFKYSIAK